MQRSGSRDRRDPAGGRTRLIAALAALVALVAPLVVGGTASGRLPDADVTAAVRAAHVHADRLEALATRAASLELDVREVAAEVASLGERLSRDRSEGIGERRGLDARVQRYRDVAATAARRIIPQTTDLTALARPLDIVSAAIHASDERAIAALEAEADVESHEHELASLAATVRQTRFRLAMTARAVQTVAGEMTNDIRVAVHGGAQAMVADVRRAPRRADIVLGELHASDLALRGAESRLGGVAVMLDDWREGARRAVRSSRRMLSELYGDMLMVQNVLSTVMPMSSLFDGVTAPPVAATGSGPLFVCPVDPPRSYSDDFGAPRYAGGFHLHEGNDIFAAEGTYIRAPFDGTAVDTSNALGGNAVSVYGADGYVYNAHLSAFGTLGQVSAGTVIGYVGNTGDADASPTHDHFEWHPGNGAAVDPYPYLNAVC
ncbi:MAG: peptidoglycan DD-metalloendopeptidase family protein [Actinomycetota bacterium]